MAVRPRAIPVRPLTPSGSWNGPVHSLQCLVEVLPPLVLLVPFSVGLSGADPYADSAANGCEVVVAFSGKKVWEHSKVSVVQ